MSELYANDGLDFIKTHFLNDPQETILHVRCLKCHSKASCTIAGVDGLYNFFENHAHHRCFVKSEFMMEDVEILKEAPLPPQAQESKQPVEGVTSNGNGIKAPEPSPGLTPLAEVGRTNGTIIINTPEAEARREDLKTDIKEGEPDEEETDPQVLPVEIEQPFETSSDSIREGFVKLYRKIRNHPIYQDSYLYHLFCHLLFKANYKPKRSLFNGSEIIVRRGQLITGTRKLAEETKISHWIIRKRLETLENLKVITQETTQHYRLITICNYDHYQGEEAREPHTKPHTKKGKEQPEGESAKITHPPHTPHTHPTTSKEYKEYKEGSGKKTPDPRVTEFLNWWCEEVHQKTGTPYLVTHGKDENLIKRALSTFDPEPLRVYAQDFLRDDQGRREGFTIGVFYQALNRIAQKHTDSPLEAAKRHQREREAREYGNPN